jgi:hypothetical protein
MCKVNQLFSDKELKALGKKGRDALEEHALSHVRNSPEIHKIISEHPKVRRLMKTKPHEKFRKAMREKLRATYEQLKERSP